LVAGGQRAEDRGQRAEDRGQRAEAEYRGQRTEGRRQRTEYRGQRGMKIGSFRDLIVYQKAFDLQQQIFIVTKNFPKEELYSLTDQIRRSSRSIGANLCEAGSAP